MINGAAPLFTLAIATLWFRFTPTWPQVAGLFFGFVGVLAIGTPATGGGSATMLGVGLVLLATVAYGVAFNLAAPLQPRNGALPVIRCAQLVALVLTTHPAWPGSPPPPRAGQAWPRWSPSARSAPAWPSSP